LHTFVKFIEWFIFDSHIFFFKAKFIPQFCVLNSLYWYNILIWHAFSKLLFYEFEFICLSMHSVPHNAIVSIRLINHHLDLILHVFWKFLFFNSLNELFKLFSNKFGILTANWNLLIRNLNLVFLNIFVDTINVHNNFRNVFFINPFWF
jgi:hypothetical protein